MRFGITPLYISKEDIDLAIELFQMLFKILYGTDPNKKQKFVT